MIHSFSIPWCLAALMGNLMVLVAGDPVENWPAVAPVGHLWNTYPMDQVTYKPWTGEPAPLVPVRIVAPLGGIGTGQVVATQAGGVKSLRIAISPPAGWPAGSVTARFQALADDSTPQWKWGIRYLPRLTDQAPANPIVPIRIIVQVPRTAAPGTVETALTVTLNGAKSVIPVRIEAGPFVIPQPGQWASRMDIYQSPDGVAQRYKVPLWSKEHWTLVDASLTLVGQYGSRVVWIPAVTNGINDCVRESMLRYQRNGNGWRVDASRMDAYLDLFAKRCGEPDSIVVYAWGTLAPATDVHALRGTEAGLANTVAVVTGTDGKPITVKGFTAERKALYKAAFDAVRASVTRRKWKQEAVRIGIAMDPVPSRFFVDFLKEPSGNAPWVKQAHDPAQDFHGVPVAYNATFRGSSGWDGPFWSNPRLIVHWPYDCGPSNGLGRLYGAVGWSFSKGMRGMACPMADFWNGYLWVGGQGTMNNYGQYIFQPGPRGAEHSLPSLVLLQAAQAGEAAFRIARAGGSEAADWIAFSGSETSAKWGARWDIADQERVMRLDRAPDLEAALFKAAAGK